MKLKVLSGSGLKVIAVATMLCDHLAKFYLCSFAFATKTLFMVAGVRVNVVYLLSAVIGRVAFPLFAFLLVEGYRHTRNVKRYAAALAVFAVLSIVPFSLMYEGCMFTLHKQNVLFTLLLGLLAIVALDRWRGVKGALVLILSLSVAYVGRVDYGPIGVCLIAVLYALREQRRYQPLAVVASLFRGKYSPGVLLAAVPILMYNGERGFIRGRIWKYAFYAFYPLHLLAIYLLR